LVAIIVMMVSRS